jgi:hypothetical protein
MSSSNELIVDAKVARFRVARLRLARLLIPVAVGASILARRLPSFWTAAFAFVVIGGNLALFLSAVQRLGWQPLRFERGGLSVGATGVRIERRKVHDWTLVGGLARLYGLEESFAVRARRGNEQEILALIQHHFGPPTALHRRGSRRARLIALGVAVGGIAAIALGIALDALMVLPFAIPGALLGIATFGALSQRCK